MFYNDQVLSHIARVVQSYFTGMDTSLWFLQCQWSSSEYYGWLILTNLQIVIEEKKHKA